MYNINGHSKTEMEKETEIKNWQYSRCCCVVAGTAERNPTAMWRMAAESSGLCNQHVRESMSRKLILTLLTGFRCVPSCAWTSEDYCHLVCTNPMLISVIRPTSAKKLNFRLYETNSDINAPMKEKKKHQEDIERQTSSVLFPLSSKRKNVRWKFVHSSIIPYYSLKGFCNFIGCKHFSYAILASCTRIALEDVCFISICLRW